MGNVSRVKRFDCTQLAAKTVGILVLLCGLFLLGVFTLFLVALIANGMLELSIDGFLSSVGLLMIGCMGLYFIWIGFCILVLKRISGISALLLAVIPAIFTTFGAAYLIKTFWKRPAEGYSFVSSAFFITITMVVFLISLALILRLFARIFKKGGHC